MTELFISASVSASRQTGHRPSCIDSKEEFSFAHCEAPSVKLAAVWIIYFTCDYNKAPNSRLICSTVVAKYILAKIEHIMSGRVNH